MKIANAIRFIFTFFGEDSLYILVLQIHVYSYFAASLCGSYVLLACNDISKLFLLLFRFELGIESGSDPSSTYHIGQVIKCRITSSVPSSKRISLSFVMKPARFDSIYLISRWVWSFHCYILNLRIDTNKYVSATLEVGK